MRDTALGALREWLVIQQKPTVSDGQGGRELAPGGWQTVAEVPGAVVSRGGGEQQQAQKVGSIVSYDAEIVYRADVTPKMRVLWTPYLGTQKTLEILTVAPKDGRMDRLILQCAEVV